ncbi:MAG: DUF192 domain-containing protein [Actinomycetota bacterium]|nr:DUF192 domain-containing protein [Actinomycetota bacterium]
MHPRWARAPTARATAGESSFDVVVARSERLRLLGFMGIDEEDFVPLLFPRCRSIHTYWMKAPIDVVWLELGDDGAEVIATASEIEARRRVKAPKARRETARRSVAALELPAGMAGELELSEGDRLALAPAHA